MATPRNLADVNPYLPTKQTNRINTVCNKYPPNGFDLLDGTCCSSCELIVCSRASLLPARGPPKGFVAPPQPRYYCAGDEGRITRQRRDFKLLSSRETRFLCYCCEQARSPLSKLVLRKSGMLQVRPSREDMGGTQLNYFKEAEVAGCNSFPQSRVSRSDVRPNRHRRRREEGKESQG